MMDVLTSKKHRQWSPVMEELAKTCAECSFFFSCFFFLVRSRSVALLRRLRPDVASALPGIPCSFIRLCVTMRKGRQAKDGLYQFRTICTQGDRPDSLERVLKFFLEAADEGARAAQVRGRMRYYYYYYYYLEDGVSFLSLSLLSLRSLCALSLLSSFSLFALFALSALSSLLSALSSLCSPCSPSVYPAHPPRDSHTHR